jgi:DNA-binding MarR family transcriptional regulator
LSDAGYVFRSSDPTDGRAGIVELTAKGTDAWKRYRAAADAISAEAFAEWSTDDLHTLRVLLERMARDVLNVPRREARQSRAS